MAPRIYNTSERAKSVAINADADDGSAESSVIVPVPAGECGVWKPLSEPRQAVRKMQVPKCPRPG